MLRTPHLALFFVVLLVWGILNQLAIRFYWYWLFWWFDILMHFFGGFLVVLGGLIFFASSPMVDRLFLRRSPLLAAILGAVGVSFLWEIYEAGVGIIELPDYLLDSVLDVLTGLAGGLIAYLVVARQRRATP